MSRSGMVIEPVTRGLDSGDRAPVWVQWARVEQRKERPPEERGIFSRERGAMIRAAMEARTALRDAAVVAAAATEQARVVAQALDMALAALGAAEVGQATMGPVLPASSRAPAGLSPREREVLALVAEGRSNKAIAEALFVSPNTVKTHVAALLNKLHADSRVQLATIASRHQGCS